MFHVKHPGSEKLDAYRRLVTDYHETLDLVSDRALSQFDRHLADASAYADVIAGLSPAVTTVLDVGSGVGLPGIVVATLLPRVRVLLVERRRRRAAFLQLACGKLDLPNALVIKGDVTDLENERADVVTAQGVGSFLDIYRLTCRSHAAEVVLLSRKGAAWRDEWAEASAALDTVITVSGEVPLQEHGTLVALRLAGGRACPS